MSSLNWQPVSPKSPLNVAQSTTGNPWFVVTVGLICIMVGFGVGKLRTGNFPIAQGSPPPVAQVPTPPPAAPEPPAEPTTAENFPAIDPKTDHIRGDISKATVAVVEYSDFECPFCQRHHPTMTQIMDTYKDDVVWVYRHYPLSFHANAAKEAEATECANELGGNDAFWNYTDAIFERTTAGGTGFPLDQLPALAKELGLNEAAFKTCLDSGKYAQHVQDDMNGGSQAGVNGTPGNIVVHLKTDENRIISGAQSFSSFKTVIDQLLGT